MDENREFDKIVNAEISETMRSSYIDYAMSVIVARALPDVRDGLKPVHRRILFSMNEMGLAPNKAHKKSARITGDTMGKYHPHGDAAIYDALVRLAQDFSMRYPLVDGHGNFGSIDGYPAAAARYTEARLSRISTEMLADIDKETVDFIPNYDGDFMEPTVLPSRIPNLLVNGATGIAVGMATNIPPHNLTEVINAIVKIIDNKVEESRETDIDEIIQYIKGPDFPTGGNILGRNGIMSAYKTGRGKLKVRAQAEILTKPNGREEILITEIPYGVNKNRMISGIADLVKEKKIEGISGIQDSTNDRNGIHILIEVKKDASAEIVLNNLYKYSQLQETYSVNLLAIVDGVPQVLNIKQMLEHYLKFQEEVVTRRTRFDLKKALERLHILEGFLKALDNIDEVINILRSSRTTPEAKERLVERFGFTEIQVNAICEMRLRALVGMEREKLQNEYAELTKFAEEMRAILADENKLFEVIKTELLEIKNRYGDDRRTRLIQDMGEIDIEDLIEDEMSVITMTHLNYIKRIPLSTYKSQNRGGKGIIGMQTREEDAVKNLFLSSNHSYLLFFTNMGKVYRIKTWEIPEAGRNAKGTPIINVLEMGENEKITAVIQAKDYNDDSGYLMMITKSGIIKKTPTNMFNNIRRSGLIAVNLRDNDELISVQKTDGNMDIFVVTHLGMAIRFNENDLRSLGRTAAGVKAINLNEGDSVIGAEIISPDKKVLIVSEKGYGKCTESSSFKVQNRGGKGLKAYKITEKTGNIIGLAMVNDNEELIMVTSQGVIIRIRIKDISTVGRVTQGVKLINVGDDVTVVSMAKISEEDIEEENEKLSEDEETADTENNTEE
ncbi:MAG: DNA gyrase subunit A [Firmicutes bacterium]|nr:DNA gyrase subunit A [Bacillota bacterium]